MERRQESEALGGHDVHVWWFAVDEPFDPAAATDADKELAAQFVSPGASRRSLVGRARLREVCALYTPGAQTATVSHKSSGRPFVPGMDLECSVSHTDNVVAIAIARRPVGIDVEVSNGEPLDENLVAKWSTTRQRRRLAGKPQPERDELFLRTWVAREAFVKALGVGLTPHIRANRVTIATGENDRRAGWRVRNLPAPVGHTAAVGARGMIWRVSTKRSI